MLQQQVTPLQVKCQMARSCYSTLVLLHSGNMMQDLQCLLYLAHLDSKRLNSLVWTSQMLVSKSKKVMRKQGRVRVLDDCKGVVQC